MGLFGKPPEVKPPDPKARPRSGAPLLPPPASTACIIGSKITVKGEVTGDDDVLVEGAVEGQITISRDLRVGPHGKVKATVHAQSIVVNGEIVGDCHATSRVEIQASGRLTGDIRAPKVVIAEGARFRGNSDMSGRKDERADKAAVS